MHLRTALPLLLIGLLPLRGPAADYRIIEIDEINSLRLAAILDEDADSDGDATLGFEIGVGSHIYPLDEAFISFSHVETGDANHEAVFIGIEERYQLFRGVRPYAYAGGGRAWVSQSDGDDTNGWFGRVGGGVLFSFTTTFHLYVQADYSFSDDDLWSEKGGLTDSNFAISGGLRYYY